MEREEEAEKEQDCYHCAHCNVTLGSLWNLTRHEGSKRHQNKIEQDCYHCAHCNITLGSLRNLTRHEGSKRHQNKIDPAQAKLATLESKATRDEKETARKAGDKEKHRLAARHQSNNNVKRKRSKADKDAKQRALSIIQYRKQTEREEDALKAYLGKLHVV